MGNIIITTLLVQRGDNLFEKNLINNVPATV